MSEDRVKPKSKSVILRETVSGLVVAAIGGYLVLSPPEAFGVSALYVGAGMVGTGLFFANKKLMAEWMIQLRDLARFWKNGNDA